MLFSYKPNLRRLGPQCAGVVLIWGILTGAAGAAVPGTPIAQPDLAVEAVRFEEPLVPTIETSPEEDAALVTAIGRYHNAPTEDFAALEAFVADQPRSGWRLAVLTNIGLLYYHYGYFSRALDAFERAWREGRSSTEPHAKALADRAAGELLGMHARLAHAGRLVALLDQTGAIGLSGRATEAHAGAKEALWALQNNISIACGVTALKSVMLAGGSSRQQIAFLDSYHVGPKGVPLAEVGRLAEQAGLPYRLIRRSPGEPVPAPSVMHWKMDHFSAVIARQGDRYELMDATFGQPQMWLSHAAFDAEASGYFLVPDTRPTPFWRDVSTEEAEHVRGRSEPAP